MIRLLLPALLLCTCATAAAQPADGAADARRATPWGVGAAVAAFDSPYAGEGSRVRPLPLVSYEGDRVYFRGITAGWTFWRGDALAVSAIAEPRLEGFDVKDLGRGALARNGIDADLLEDRDDGASVGLRAVWSGSAGQLEARALTDVTGASDGHDASLQYGYPIRLATGVLTPTVGARWLSADAANYYFGTLDAEVARGVVDYRPGAATIPRVGLSYFRPVGTRWSLIASVDYSALPSKIRNSPLVEPGTDGTASVFIGLSRGFVPWWAGRR